MGAPADGGSQLRRVSLATALRHRWTIIGCTLGVLAIALVLTKRAVPIYEGTSTLRIQEKQPNLPEVFRTSNGSDLETEMEELHSRALAAQVVTELGLRLELVEPRLSRRSDLLKDVRVSDSAPNAGYRLVRSSGDRFVLFEEAAAQPLGEFAPGDRIEIRGCAFVLSTTALEYPMIRISVGSVTPIAARLAGRISVTQPSRDAAMVNVSYSSPDQELAWKVPQALVTHYVAQRQELQTMQTRSTIDFLRRQIATMATQLADAEAKLESFRERREVINPQAEATNQVGRLVSMQTQRGMLDNERQAMSELLAEVDAKAKNHKPGEPSPYRRLLAFPTLLQSQAASGLLLSLSTAEDQRTLLLTKRTSEDPEVKALDRRIDELGRELRAMAATYLQGLSNQVQSLDAGLESFRRQLRNIPQKEMEFARLERQPKILEGVYIMLQTRLKEAEVAAASRDASVRVVDAAIPPTRPISPKPLVNALAALMCGALLGIGLAFAREYRDGAVRSRFDVHVTAGLPVLGLIPRIPKAGTPIALIAERSTKRAVDSRLLAPPTPPPARAKQRRTYTFLAADPSEEQEEVFIPRPVRSAVPGEQVVLTMLADWSVQAEAYAVLQTNIAFARENPPLKTVVFTSPLPGDGKTTTVVNLAFSLAQRGLRVLLIDADLRRGVVHSAFGTPREPGLSEVLRGTLSFESVRRSAIVGERGRVDYLTTGKLQTADQGLVGSEMMRNLLAQVRQEYDLTILDTPPVNIITDAALLGASVDGVILVVRSAVTEAVALSYAVDQLQHVRAPILGVVLNDINLRRDAAYDNSYKYMTSYEYRTSNA
jgi:tyrosine-protein kinase Etk/Wzc